MHASHFGRSHITDIFENLVFGTAGDIPANFRIWSREIKVLGTKQSQILSATESGTGILFGIFKRNIQIYIINTLASD